MTTPRTLLGGRSRWLAAVLALGVASLTVPVAHAQEDDPTRKVLAVVSPLAASACSTSGTATLLVPILGGVVGDELGVGDNLSVGDLLLDSLGPVFVVCGTLPAPKGMKCALVDQQIIAALWVPQVAGLAKPPTPLGNGVESLDNLVGFAGLSAVDLLGKPLQCSLPEAAVAPPAPPAPPPSMTNTSSPLMPAGSGGGGLSQVPSAAGTAPTVESPSSSLTTPGSATSTPLTAVDVIRRTVSGPIALLQLIVALALIAFLTRSWLTSWKLSRTS